MTKTKKTVGVKKVRCGRPSNLEVARRAAEGAKIADVRIGGVDDIFQGTDVIVNAGVHPQLLELSSEQLFALAVMRESQQSSLQVAGTTGNEPISIG